MRTRIGVSCASFVAAALLAGGAGFAQTITGQISGTVRDTQGGVLPGVTVTATNINTGIARTEATGIDGAYRFTNLAIGTYSVTAEVQGFRKAEKTGFELFNTDAFATAPDDRRGNARVGMIEGPHLFTVDPSLRKNFNLTRQVRVNLRVDAFNVFNRVNFTNPAIRQDQAAFGTITSARPPRQMQFSLRLEF